MNQPLRTILIDDEPQVIANLATLLAKHSEVRIIETITDSVTASKIMLEREPDVVLFDIDARKDRLRNCP